MRTEAETRKELIDTKLYAAGSDRTAFYHYPSTGNSWYIFFCGDKWDSDNDR